VRCTVVVSVSVLLLAVSAGCSGFLPADGGAQSSRDPYEVPLTETETPTGTSAETTVADGFDLDDFFLPAVVEGHTNGLEGKSFSVKYAEVVRDEDGTTLRKDRTRARLAANRTRFAISKGQWRSGNTWEYERFWSPGSRAPVLHATEREGPTEYVAYTAADADPILVKDVVADGGRFRNRLFQIASVVENATVTPPSESNVYVVNGTEFSDQWLINRGENGTVSNVSLVIIVRRTGVIDRLELRYGLTVDGRTVRITERYRFRLVGRTNVTAPTWANVSMSSVETAKLDGSRDSVGLPMVSGGGTSFDDESDNVTDPYPPRSLGDPSGSEVPPSGSDGVARADSAVARSGTTAAG
jgi:hypothetical protein